MRVSDLQPPPRRASKQQSSKRRPSRGSRPSVWNLALLTVLAYRHRRHDGGMRGPAAALAFQPTSSSWSSPFCSMNVPRSSSSSSSAAAATTVTCRSEGRKKKNERIALMVTLDPQQQDESSSSSSPPPLFDVDSLDTKSSFRVEDVSHLQQAEEVVGDDDNNSDREDAPPGFYDVGAWDFDDEQQGVVASSADNELLDYARDEDDMLTEREDRGLVRDLYADKRKVQTCILVGVEDLSAKRTNRKKKLHSNPEEWGVHFSLEESMVEMRELIKTAGMELVGEVTQRLNEPNPRTYVGTGKVKEAEEMLKLHECDTVVFDAELSPGQQKALENAFNKKVLQNDFLGSEQEREINVVDRTALILDIFAQHAKTREGKLQVDLALHEYRKPRLTRMWTHLERQSGAGGVGLRGPGESQLEIDKRLLRDRIIVLKKKINDVQKQRDLHRRGRINMGLPILALVGYTNAGKSTLLNFLTRAGVMAENILFATLDPTTRKVKLPGYKTHPEVLLTDTVGFIQKLPTHLVAAFRATLEEVREADVLVHVVDVSNPAWEKQEGAVRSVLSEIGAGDKPVVTVYNKIDLLDPDDAEYLRYEAAMTGGNSVAVSSLSGEGMQDFVAVVEDALSELLVPIEVEIPYSKGEELNLIHEVGNVETIDYRETGTYVAGRVPRAVANRLEPYFVGELGNDNNNQTPHNEQHHQQTSSSGNNVDDDDDDEIDWVALGRGRHASKNA